VGTDRALTGGGREGGRRRRGPVCVGERLVCSHGRVVHKLGQRAWERAGVGRELVRARAMLDHAGNRRRQRVKLTHMLSSAVAAAHQRPQPALPRQQPPPCLSQERERERERECVCVCVCERERERERERGGERERRTKVSACACAQDGAYVVTRLCARQDVRAWSPLCLRVCGCVAGAHLCSACGERRHGAQPSHHHPPTRHRGHIDIAATLTWRRRRPARDSVSQRRLRRRQQRRLEGQTQGRHVTGTPTPLLLARALKACLDRTCGAQPARIGGAVAAGPGGVGYG
jgi:hypothetical protein